MAVCNIQGNREMYGLGIRLGFYFQWLGTIFATWMAPTEIRFLRNMLDLFIAAVFLALIILTARDVNELQPAETYIVLLLISGAYLSLVPIYFGRLLTACDPYWNPNRWPVVRLHRLSANMSYILLVGVLVYQYWFWFARLPILERLNCQQYGFLFGQVRLNSKSSVVVNALLYFFLGLVCLYILAAYVGKTMGIAALGNRRKRRVSRREKEIHIQLLQNMDGWSKLVVATIVGIAIEFSIQWNELGEVNSLAGAGQTIPFVIGLSAVLRVLYVYLLPQYNDDDSYDSDSIYSRHRARGGGLPPRRPSSSIRRDRASVELRVRRNSLPREPSLPRPVHSRVYVSRSVSPSRV